MGFLEDIASKLNSDGVVVYPGSATTRTCYISEMPDAPDAVVCLYARPGRSRVLYSGGELRRPDLHIEVRAATYGAAVAKMESVCDSLHRFEGVIGARLFTAILAVSEMVSLGRDARNRAIISQNFEVRWAA